MEKFRHEFKYLISYEQMRLIADRLKRVMKLDPHAKDGRYLISSLYYDDPYDSCFYEVAAGVDLRKKYRLRYYDHDASAVFLECKAKRNNMMLKKNSYLEHYDALKLVNGGYLRDIADQDDLNKELTYKIMARGFKPKVIVEYERVPYVYEAGNIRITFDMNITSSTDLKNFLGQYAYKRSVLPCGSLIMEVKYDEFLPSLIYDCIDIGGLEQLSISKYTLCRKYMIQAEDLL